MILKGRGLKMGMFVGGGEDLDFKNFWDGVYNFFFCFLHPSSVTEKSLFTNR